MKKIIAAMNSKAPTAAPTPMPDFAPVLRPSAEALTPAMEGEVGDGAEVAWVTGILDGAVLAALFCVNVTGLASLSMPTLNSPAWCIERA